MDEQPFIKEPDSTQDATRWLVKVLDAIYHKADVQAIVNTYCNHLNAEKEHKLL